MDCLVNDNRSALIISGYPDPNELEAAWESIQMQYHDAMGNAEYLAYISQLKAITLDKVAYNTVLFCIKQLSDILEAGAYTEQVEPYRKHYASELNKLLQTDFVFDFNDPEKYIHNLQRCNNRSRGLKVNLELKLLKFEALQEKEDKNKEKADHAYFSSVLITLSDAAGYQIKDDITVFEYCQRIKRLHTSTK